MKRKYDCPRMYAETFIANQYVAACSQPMYETDPTKVKCISKGHQNTQYITMFTDQQNACVALFVPKVGTVDGDEFYTKFNACRNVDGCNKRTWLADHPKDTSFKLHVWEHGDSKQDDSVGTGFMNHDTVIDLSLAQKYNLS